MRCACYIQNLSFLGTSQRYTLLFLATLAAYITLYIHYIERRALPLAVYIHDWEARGCSTQRAHNVSIYIRRALLKLKSVARRAAFNNSYIVLVREKGRCRAPCALQYPRDIQCIYSVYIVYIEIFIYDIRKHKIYRIFVYHI